MHFSLTIVLTFFLQIIQNTFKLDEMLNACSDQLDGERKRQATAVQTLSKSEQDLADARKTLQVEERARKSAESALEGYQKHRGPRKASARGECRAKEDSGASSSS